MKKWLRLGAVAAWCAAAGWAVYWKALKPQGCAGDFAGVIDASSKLELESCCGAVEHATDVRIAPAAISSLEGEPIEDLANAMARARSAGQQGKNEGIRLHPARNAAASCTARRRRRESGRRSRSRRSVSASTRCRSTSCWTFARGW